MGYKFEELPPRQPKRTEEYRCEDCGEVGYIICPKTKHPRYCPMCGAKHT